LHNYRYPCAHSYSVTLNNSVGIVTLRRYSIR